jgi:hypothetical protein
MLSPLMEGIWCLALWGKQQTLNFVIQDGRPLKLQLVDLCYTQVLPTTDNECIMGYCVLKLMQSLVPAGKEE